MVVRHGRSGRPKRFQNIVNDTGRDKRKKVKKTVTEVQRLKAQREKAMLKSLIPCMYILRSGFQRKSS
jgi:hypothetical protein